MTWEPSAEDIDQKLTEMTYVWGDIEGQLEQRAADAHGEDGEANFVSGSVDRAFRVEAVVGRNNWNDPCSFYVLLFDVTDSDARETKNLLEQNDRRLREVVEERARPWHSTDFLIYRAVPKSTPVEGQICRRLGEEHPPLTPKSFEEVSKEAAEEYAIERAEQEPRYVNVVEDVLPPQKRQSYLSRHKQTLEKWALALVPVVLGVLLTVLLTAWLIGR